MSATAGINSRGRTFLDSLYSAGEKTVASPFMRGEGGRGERPRRSKGEIKSGLAAEGGAWLFMAGYKKRPRRSRGKINSGLAAQGEL